MWTPSTIKLELQHESSQWSLATLHERLPYYVANYLSSLCALACRPGRLGSDESSDKGATLGRWGQYYGPALAGSRSHTKK